MYRITDFFHLAIPFLVLSTFLWSCHTTQRAESLVQSAQLDSLSVSHSGVDRVGDSLSIVSFTQWWEQQQQFMLLQIASKSMGVVTEQITTVTDSAGVISKVENRTTFNAQASTSASLTQQQQMYYLSSLYELNRKLDSLSCHFLDSVKQLRRDTLSHTSYKIMSPSARDAILTYILYIFGFATASVVLLVVLQKREKK